MKHCYTALLANASVPPRISKSHHFFLSSGYFATYYIPHALRFLFSGPISFLSTRKRRTFPPRERKYMIRSQPERLRDSIL